MIAVTHASSIVPILLILVAVVIIFGSIAVVFALGWEKTPWWRSTPKPKRIYKNAKDQIKFWKLEQKYPDAFKKASIDQSLVEDSNKKDLNE